MSKQIRFRKSQLAVALASVFAASAVSAAVTSTAFITNAAATQTTIDQDVSIAVPGTPIDSTANTDEVNPADYPITPIINSGVSTTVRTLIFSDITAQTDTQLSGGAQFDANTGNLTLTGATVQTVKSQYDLARYAVIDQVQGSPTQGQEISNVSYVGTYDAVNDNFTINAAADDPVTTTAYQGGGNLTMDGLATIKDGLNVTTRTTATAAEGTGAGLLTVNATTAQIGVKNAGGGVNGVSATTTSATLAGGTGTSYLHMTNNGAQFSSSSNVNAIPSSSNAIRVTGIAAGTDPYDAVNYAQFSGLQSDFNSAYSSLKKDIKEVENKAYGGIAAAVALAGIPAPAAGKQYTVGAGWGNYEGENAFALGGRAQITPEFQLTAGWGYSSEGNAFNVGAGYSW